MKLRHRLVASVVSALALVSLSVTGAAAAAGDSGRSTNTDSWLTTNICKGSEAMTRFEPNPEPTLMTAYVATGSGTCKMRGRFKYVNSSGRVAWTSYGYASRAGLVAQAYGRRCYTQFQQQRRDGTWYSQVQYRPNPPKAC